MTEAQAPLLDPEALAELRGLDPDGSNGLLARMVQAWERSLERLLPELDAALAGGPDAERLRRVAHTLKSSCANLAALNLAAGWQVIEQQCKEGQVTGIEAQVARLRAELGRVHEALCAIR